MTMSQEQKFERQEEMFGTRLCGETLLTIKKQIETSLSPEHYVMSMLSDVQSLNQAGEDEEADQTLNLAKLILSELAEAKMYDKELFSQRFDDLNGSTTNSQTKMLIW